MSYIEKEKLIKEDIASIENKVRHAFNQGYDLGFKDGKGKAKLLEQELQSFKWCDTCKEYDQEKHCCHRYSKVIRDTVAKIDQEPRWIPASERLPEYMETVLTWDGGAFCIEKRIPYILDADGEPVKSDWWVGDEYEADAFDYYPNLRDGAPIAWMPLPEPFDPQKSEG